MTRRVVSGVLAMLCAWPVQAQQLPAQRFPASPQNQLPPTITLPSELVTEIALYLQERPYREVAGLLGALQQAVAEQTRQAGQSGASGSPTH